jgi:hypothetical protein
MGLADKSADPKTGACKIKVAKTYTYNNRNWRSLIIDLIYLTRSEKSWNNEVCIANSPINEEI